jgi:hypothetical protein
MIVIKTTGYSDKPKEDIEYQQLITPSYSDEMLIYKALGLDGTFDVQDAEIKIDIDNIIYITITKTVTHEENEKILSILGIKKYGE